MTEEPDSAPPAADVMIGPVGLREAANGVWRCLPAGTRRKLVVSGVLGFVLAIVDAAAVGLLPTLVNRVEGDTGGLMGGRSVPVLAGIIGGLLLLKSLAGAALVYWQAHFLAQDEGEQTIDLFAHYVAKPYGAASRVNTNDVVRDLHVSMPMLYRGGASGIGLGMVDALSLVLLVAVVVVRSPITGLALAVLAVGSGAVYSGLIRRPVAALGDRILSQTADVLRDMTEGLDAMKTVKAFGVESTITERFTLSRRRFELPMRDYQAYQQLSRYFLEIALVLVLGASIGVVYLAEGSEAVFATVGLLSGVAARAMPAMARLLNSITNVRVAGAVVESLREDLDAIQAGPVEVSGPALEVRPGQVGIVVDDVAFRYPGTDTHALSGASMEVRPGEIVAVMGGSGTGKTSLVDVMVGLQQPSSGSVQIPPGASVGYVAQDTFVWDSGVGFNVALDRPAPHGDAEQEVWAALGAAHLDEWVRTLPDPLRTPLGERGTRMSGGQRQRLGLARALYGGPSFLVLDEPTSSLDDVTSKSILTTLTELKQRVGIVIVTHDPIVESFADRVLRIDELQGRARPGPRRRRSVTRS